MQGVAYEAERHPGYCKHVSNPQPPTILVGRKPSEAVAIAAERAARAVDSRGHALRIDGLVFLGGVASFPVRWTEVRTNKLEQEKLRAWLAYLLTFLKQQYGTSLHYVLLHMDEPYPHVHWGAVPGQLRHSEYIANWLQLLRDDDRAVFTAASKASQAADYLRGFSEQLEEAA